MKTRLYSLLALMTFLAACNVRAAVSFTVSPSSISNTYMGTITLQVAGLTNGESVLVQKFLDANTNGVVDAGDLLWQQFQLSDGSASVFHNGGTAVTNFNVPGDTDSSTNGSITAKLYPSLDFSQVIVGKYLFVLSSTAGQFSPITNSFSVTNFPYAQSFTGTVVSNSTPVPNAVVILFQPSSGGGDNPQAGVVADNSGHYTIKAATGTYVVAGAKSNFVANLVASPDATLTSGAIITTNVPLTAATETISGNVIDVNNSSKGLAGYLVPLQTKDNLLAIAFTATNGNYSAGVTPDVWKISGDNQGIAYKGYLGLQNKPTEDTTGGSVSGVTLALPKATAIFYGTVKDNHGNPLSGIDVYTSDQSGFYQSDGYTYTNGSYVALALNNGSDPWQIEISSDNNPINYVYSPGTNNVTFSSGQAIQVNFTALVATNTITGHVQDNTGNSLSNIGVNANNSTGYNAHADTDSNGNYTLYVANNDTWSVSLNCCDSCDDGLGSNYQCPDSQDLFINNNNGTANFTVQPSGGSGPYQIFGYVLDNSSNPVAGVDVHGQDTNGDVYTGTTDGSGYYSIGVGNGDWDVFVDCDELNGLGYQCPNDDFVTVSGSSIEADFTVPGGGSSGQIGNGGFETGDFTSWTLADSSNNTFVDDGSASGITPRSGFYAAELGAIGQLGTLSQTLNTTPGKSYLLSLWLNSPDGATPNEFRVIWNGNTLVDQVNMPATGWTNLRFIVTASASSTVLEFIFRDDHSYLALDDVSLQAGPSSPIVQFSATPSYGPPPLAVQFSSPNVDSSGSNIVSWNWTFGDGATSTSQNPSHTYNNLGTFTPTLVATNNNGVTVMGNGPTITVSYLKILHLFTGGNDGGDPVCGLILSSNTLYGTANLAGLSGFGIVFKVNTDGSGFTNLHAFSWTDGGDPQASLILSGNTLYGTTLLGGSSGIGTVFKMNTDGSGFSNIYDFTGLTEANYFTGTNSVGAAPGAALVLAGNALYGTTEYGGANGNGIIFRVNTDGTGFTNLHNFVAKDGAPQTAGLTLLGDTLYGTTVGEGSAFGNGTVFSMNTNGTLYSVLYTFNYNDGAYPMASLFLSSNTLFGTTSAGGSPGYGGIFRINTDATGFSGLHGFDSFGTGGFDPQTGLILQGNTLYGTTLQGGSGSNGTLFALNSDGTGFTNLYDFSPGSGSFPNTITNSEGALPWGTLVVSGSTLYGTTADGGSFGQGTVFSFPLSSVTAPQLSIVSISLSGTNLVLQCSNGQAGKNYITRMSSDLALPVNQWTPIASNTLNASGNFIITATNAVNLSAPKRFYILQAQ